MISFRLCLFCFNEHLKSLRRGPGAEGAKGTSVLATCSKAGRGSKRVDTRTALPSDLITGSPGSVKPAQVSNPPGEACTTSQSWCPGCSLEGEAHVALLDGRGAGQKMETLWVEKEPVSSDTRKK